jgi:predicted CXXCH cytochrome family protein
VNARIAIVIGAVLFAHATGARGQAGRLQPNSARECAVCHLDWVGSFDSPDAVLLIDRPAIDVVSAGETCLGCHDGSVADSRRRVWVAHGHRVGAKPPTGMTVPASWPLTDGGLDCRTCHTAHVKPQARGLADVFFLRKPNPRGELCLTCHQQDPAEPGHHPLVELDTALPVGAVVDGAHHGPNGREVTCQSCHTPHAGHDPALLVASPDDDGLCLRCHQAQAPDFWQAAATFHPLTFDASGESVRAAITARQKELAGVDQPGCLACHRMHDSPARADLLAATQVDAAFCLDCHGDFASVRTTVHDLRTSAPDERNLAGQTAAESGTCAACHRTHSPARTRTVTSQTDPSGACLTCHADGQCGAKAGGFDFHHPTGDLVTRGAEPAQPLTCTSCHNPHTDAHPSFLCAEPDTLCQQCHQQQASLVSGKHNFTAGGDLVNGRDLPARQTGNCAFCHDVHYGSGPSLWAATRQAPSEPDQYCTTCHQSGGSAGDHVAATMQHPLDEAAVARPGGLPRFNAAGQRDEAGAISCATCHNPHAGAQPAMLRVGPDESTEQLCLTCHQDAGTITKTPHGHRALREASERSGQPIPAEGCGPCHVVHADHVGPALWALPLASSGALEDERHCLSCHRAGGLAGEVAALNHIPVPRFASAQGEPLPVFYPAGQTTGIGWISCSTCHLPHGREIAGVPSTTAIGGTQDPAKRLLRSYAPPNLCSSCHGFEGLAHFLHYHEYAASQR